MKLQIVISLTFPLTFLLIEMEQVHNSAGSDNSSGIEVSMDSYGPMPADAGDFPFLITISALEARVGQPSLRRVIHVSAP